jgi:hypothetical protein
MTAKGKSQGKPKERPTLKIEGWGTRHCDGNTPMMAARRRMDIHCGEGFRVASLARDDCEKRKNLSASPYRPFHAT